MLSLKSGRAQQTLLPCLGPCKRRLHSREKWKKRKFGVCRREHFRSARQGMQHLRDGANVAKLRILTISAIMLETARCGGTCALQKHGNRC